MPPKGGKGGPQSTVADAVSLVERFAGRKLLADEIKPCTLLGKPWEGDTFALRVQFLLGSVVILALLVKWCLERPQRRLKIFFLDSSKQIVGGTIVHVVNLFIVEAIWKTQAMTKCDECDYYAFLSIVFNTVGTFIDFLLLRLSERVFDYQSGKYAVKRGMSRTWETSPNLLVWSQQMMGWVAIVMTMKAIVLTGLWVIGKGNTEMAAAWVIGGSIPDPKQKLIMAMVVIPVIGNAFQYVVADSFLRYWGEPDEKEYIPLRNDGDAPAADPGSPILEQAFSPAGSPAGAQQQPAS